ncbi:MAG: CvpA family protein [Deltaproteobacteria bacterium]|jgi:membrane protein required for colicin V production|nr:CvpA family protein [Deltaproteobacteria bacterium]
MENINLLDAGLGIVIVLFLLRGVLRGMTREMAGLVSLILGFLIAGRFYAHLAPRLSPVFSDANTAAAAAYAAIFIATLILVALLAAILRKFMTLAFSPWLDHLLGGLIGTGKGLLLCAVALALLEHFTPESPFFLESTLARHIAGVSALVKEHLPDFL